MEFFFPPLVYYLVENNKKIIDFLPTYQTNIRTSSFRASSSILSKQRERKSYIVYTDRVYVKPNFSHKPLSRALLTTMDGNEQDLTSQVMHLQFDSP